MKQKTIITSKVEMLVIDLPDGARVMESFCECILFELPDGYVDTEYPLYPQEGFELKPIGKATELTEEDWKGIVDPFSYILSGDSMSEGNGETVINIACSTATESGLSLLKANGVVLENELGKRPDATTFDTTGAYIHMVDVWQEAESKVWRNCHVFIKKD